MRELGVIIADDEQVIVDGFLKLVDWQRLGVRVISTASDGIMALNQVVGLKPDIVVMDINMPLLSGLEVIRQANMECPQTTFIIISGYDDFSYTREALKLRVYDYLLKPVDFSGFEELILRLRREQFDRIEPPAPAPLEGELPTVNRIVAYINEHFSEDLSLKTLSEKFYMNPAYLSQYFKNKTGMNYHAYLSRLRMEKAKQLLVSTDQPIAEIAARAGFYDYRAFTRRFHREEGLTPSQYRRHNRG